MRSYTAEFEWVVPSGELSQPCISRIYGGYCVLSVSGRVQAFYPFLLATLRRDCLRRTCLNIPFLSLRCLSTASFKQGYPAFLLITIPEGLEFDAVTRALPHKRIQVPALLYLRHSSALQNASAPKQNPRCSVRKVALVKRLSQRQLPNAMQDQHVPRSCTSAKKSFEKVVLKIKFSKFSEISRSNQQEAQSRHTPGAARLAKTAKFRQTAKRDHIRVPPTRPLRNEKECYCQLLLAESGQGR